MADTLLGMLEGLQSDQLADFAAKVLQFCKGKGISTEWNATGNVPWNVPNLSESPKALILNDFDKEKLNSWNVPGHVPGNVPGCARCAKALILNNFRKAKYRKRLANSQVLEKKENKETKKKEERTKEEKKRKEKKERKELAITVISSKIEKPYSIPEPKENPLGAIVMVYKAHFKQIPFDDRVWDKSHWPRCLKAAKDLLAVCTSYEAVKAFLEEFAKKMEEKDLTWSLETAVKWSHDWKIKQGGKDYGIANRSGFFNAVTQQRTEKRLQTIREFSTPGEISDRVRNLLEVSAQAGIAQPS